MHTQLFKALGDPLRMRMVERLADGTTRTIGELTDNLKISRQGARKQVQVLVDAHIVRLTARGREVWVTLDITSLKKGKEFIARIEREWDERLLKLKKFVEKNKKTA